MKTIFSFGINAGDCNNAEYKYIVKDGETGEHTLFNEQPSLGAVGVACTCSTPIQANTLYAIAEGGWKK